MSHGAPIGHPDFGKAFPCQCQESDAHLSARVSALERYSNLGSLRRATFAAADPNGPGDDATSSRVFADACRAAVEYAENADGWITFSGPSASGKTYLAAAIANRRIELGEPALFITAADLLDYLRSGFDEDSELPFIDLFEQVRSAPLLVLDDLPTRPATPWTQERLLQLLAGRHSAQLPTVITLRGDFGHLDEFLRTRLDSDDGFARLFVLSRTGKAARNRFGTIPTSMHQRMTFDSFKVDDRGDLPREQADSLAHALRNMMAWSERPDEQRGPLLLDGKVGVGKTHLAVAAAAERERRGDRVFFATVTDLLDQLRATFAPDNPMMHDDMLDRIKMADLLVLDDFGAERSTPFAEDKLFQIINYRYEDRLPTIITTSLDFGAIADSRPRIASRLADRRVVMRLPILAPDYRQSGLRN